MDSYFSACLRFSRSIERGGSVEVDDCEIDSNDDGEIDSGGKINSERTPPCGIPNAIYVDRDPTHFRHILNYLRDGVCPPLTSTADLLFVNELLQEARFYQIEEMVKELENYLSKRKVEDDGSRSSEKEFKMIQIKGAREVERTFKTFLQKGYELEHMLSLNPPSNCGSPLGKGSLNDYYRLEDQFPYEPRVVMVFSKSLTKADISFFDRVFQG